MSLVLKPEAEEGLQLASGIGNLLSNCAGLSAGNKLLIVVEQPGNNYYRDDIGLVVADAARARGIIVEVLAEPIPKGPEKFPGVVLEALERVDQAIFFSRLGSQARFLDLPGKSGKIATYTLDAQSLGSLFGSLPYAFVQALHDRVVNRIAAARSYSIRCENGTDLHMELDDAAISDEPVFTPFKIKNFPVMIFPPVSAARLSGRLVLTLALLPTSIHHYDYPELLLDTPLLLDIENGRVVKFGGDPEQAHRAEAHFDRVGAAVGGDPRVLNSWHTGINPATFFAGRAVDDLARWGSVAFGSPRYTHFHMVGSEPGDICGSLFDATIAFDGEVLWERGRFVFLDRPEMHALTAEFGLPHTIFDIQQPIGV